MTTREESGKGSNLWFNTFINSTERVIKENEPSKAKTDLAKILIKLASFKDLTKPRT